MLCPLRFPNEGYIGGSRTPADAAASTMDVDDDGSWSWRRSSWDTGSSSDAWGRQLTWSEPANLTVAVEGGRRTEHYRHGILGGRQRHGDRGGKNSWYYKGYYNAKSKGKGAVKAFIAKNGEPPSRGGKAFHNRKEDDEHDRSTGGGDEQLWG